MADKNKAATSKKKGSKAAKKPASTKKEETSPAKEYKPREPKGKKPSKNSKTKTESKKPKDEASAKPEDEAKTKKKHDKLVREGKRKIEKEEIKEKAKEEVKEKGKESEKDKGKDKDKDKDKDKEKDKEKAVKPKPKVKPINIAWELRKRAVKERQQRIKEIKKELDKDKPKDKDKDKGKSKDKVKGKDKDKEKDKDKVINKEILEEGKEEDQYKDIRKKKDDKEEENKSSKTKSKQLQKDSELKTESKEEKGHNKDLIDTVFHKMEVVEDPKKQKIKQEPETVIEFKYNKFEDIEELVKEKEKDILQLLHKVFQWYKPDEVMLSFNGGKDCTVVLHMLNKFFQSNSCLKHIKIPALYITDPDAFEEIDQFVSDCEEMFNIALIKKKGPIKEALKAVCDENKKLKAVFMGCRGTDPYCKGLKVTQMTDPGWPPLMRINPIIDWKCRQVWEYIYYYNVPYCILYQKGYTSIGNKKNTKPNPHLRLIDAKTGKVLDYRPGHELIDNDELERAGRF